MYLKNKSTRLKTEGYKNDTTQKILVGVDIQYIAIYIVYIYIKYIKYFYTFVHKLYIHIHLYIF